MKTRRPAMHGNVKLTDLHRAIARSAELPRACIYTVRLMMRLGLLGQAVAEFRAVPDASPFREEVDRQFVAKMSAHADSLVASMAQFEAMLRKVREGGAGRYGIEWDRNPNRVFKALEQGSDLPPSEGMPCYFVEVGAKIPGLVCCTRFAAPAHESFTSPHYPDPPSPAA